jgi:hypothetical protein
MRLSFIGFMGSFEAARAAPEPRGAGLNIVDVHGLLQGFGHLAGGAVRSERLRRHSSSSSPIGAIAGSRGGVRPRRHSTSNILTGPLAGVGRFRPHSNNSSGSSSSVQAGPDTVFGDINGPQTHSYEVSTVLGTVNA